MPEQVIPFHDCPHGSSPLAFHWVNWGGEFKLVYKTLKAEAVYNKIIKFYTRAVRVTIAISNQISTSLKSLTNLLHRKKQPISFQRTTKIFTSEECTAKNKQLLRESNHAEVKKKRKENKSRNKGAKVKRKKQLTIWWICGSFNGGKLQPQNAKNDERNHLHPPPIHCLLSTP